MTEEWLPSGKLADMERIAATLAESAEKLGTVSTIREGEAAIYSVVYEFGVENKLLRTVGWNIEQQKKAYEKAEFEGFVSWCRAMSEAMYKQSRLFRDRIEKEN